MSRQVKIRRIQRLINDVYQRKEVAIYRKCFYSNGTDFFMDSEQTIQTSEKDIDFYYRKERIRQNAERIFKIIIVEKYMSDENTN